MSNDIKLFLEVCVDILGFIGATLATVPFLKDNSIKKIISFMKYPSTLHGLERAEEKAKDVLEEELARFKQEDARYVVWGLVTVAFSYFIHVCTLII